MDLFGTDDMYMRMIRHKSYRRVSTFITAPPSENSPQHILNALDDKCIQLVLTYLIGDIRDFYNAAQVCRKFQENAKNCYPSIYKNFSVRDSDHHLPINQVKCFLSIFGHLIQSISWAVNFNNAYESEIFDAITEFCGKNLQTLNVRRHNLDFCEVSKFKLLDELYLFDSNIDNFELPPTLKKLALTAGTNVNGTSWLSETHPNLIEVRFVTFKLLNDQIVIEFQTMNPQLEIFVCTNCDTTTSILQGIATREPNLIELKFGASIIGCDKIAVERKFEEDIKHLSGLKRLKCLDYPSYPHPMASSLIVDVLADNDIPIEELNIDGENPHIVKSVAKLASLKKLKLCHFTCEMVMDLVMKVPNLIDLTIMTSAPFSLNGLKQILEQANNLEKLFISNKNMLLDSDSLMESILNLARDRVKIVLSVKSSNVSLKNPKLYNDNIKNHWLSIAY